jgi:nuclease HARBI1
LLYTKYIRGHGLKFETVQTPEGFVAWIKGPYPAPRGDARIFREGGLLDQLRSIMPADGTNGTIFSLYGDLAYPQSSWMMRGYINAESGSAEARFNTIMSSVRIAVEWSYSMVTRSWSFLSFRDSMRIFKCPVAQYYINGVFLSNLRTSIYGNQTAEYFGVTPMCLEEYLSLVD